MATGKQGKNKTASSVANRPRTILVRYTRAFKLSVLGFALVLLTLLGGFLNTWLYTAPPSRTNSGEEQQYQRESATPDRNKSDEQSLSSTGAAVEGQAGNGTTRASFASGSVAALNKQDDPDIKLTSAPDPSLSEDTPQGSLPKVGDDGRKPWQVYARPFNTQDKRPRIAVVISDLSLSRTTTDSVLLQMPTNVTLAIDAQSPIAGAWCTRARQLGHEILLQLPMEPFDYPRSDPGPNTLLTTLPNSKNTERLLWALHQGVGYVGVTTVTGSHFVTDSEKLGPVLKEINQRGLLFLDAHIAPHSAAKDLAISMHLPVGVATGRIDQVLTPAAIDDELSQIEKTVQLSGRAIIVVPPLPLILERLKVWLKDLPERGIALTPVSAMVE